MQNSDEIIAEQLKEIAFKVNLLLRYNLVSSESFRKFIKMEKKGESLKKMSMEIRSTKLNEIPTGFVEKKDACALRWGKIINHWEEFSKITKKGYVKGSFQKKSFIKNAEKLLKISYGSTCKFFNEWVTRGYISLNGDLDVVVKKK